jgi:hypothetical protein
MENFSSPHSLPENDFLNGFYRKNLELFREQSVQELIDDFNHEAKMSANAWAGARGAYLGALYDAFLERGLSLDNEVFLPNGDFCLQRCVRLEENCVVHCDRRSSDLNQDWFHPSFVPSDRRATIYRVWCIHEKTAIRIN